MSIGVTQLGVNVLTPSTEHQHSCLININTSFRPSHCAVSDKKILVCFKLAADSEHSSKVNEITPCSLSKVKPYLQVYIIYHVTPSTLQIIIIPVAKFHYAPQPIRDSSYAAISLHHPMYTSAYPPSTTNAQKSPLQRGLHSVLRLHFVQQTVVLC
jgi:hypothetical protein